jgi:hypothetical protein
MSGEYRKFQFCDLIGIAGTPINDHTLDSFLLGGGGGQTTPRRNFLSTVVKHQDIPRLGSIEELADLKILNKVGSHKARDLFNRKCRTYQGKPFVYGFDTGDQAIQSHLVKYI